MVVAGVVNSLVKTDVRVSGQTVVETASVDVTTATVWLVRGQLVTSAGQLKTVTSLVAKTVEVESAGTYLMKTAVVVWIDEFPMPGNWSASHNQRNQDSIYYQERLRSGR